MSISSPQGSATSVPPPAIAAPGHVQLAHGSTAKIRNPVVVATLSFVTLGIYGIFWWYYVNREMADYGRARGTDELGDAPGTSTLAIFPGALIVVPAIWTMVTTFQRAQSTQRLTGQALLNGWLGFVLVLVFSPAFFGYMQSGLNSAWEAASGAAVSPQPGG